MKCKKNNIIKKLSAVLTASALLLTGCSGAKSSTQTDQDLTYTDMLFDGASSWYGSSSSLSSRSRSLILQMKVFWMV